MCKLSCAASRCPAVGDLNKSAPVMVTCHLCRLGVAPDEPALSAFQTRTPLLIVGSHAWNKPYNDAGDMVCGAQQQQAILAAASASRWAADLLQGGSSSWGQHVQQLQTSTSCSTCVCSSSQCVPCVVLSSKSAAPHTRDEPLQWQSVWQFRLEASALCRDSGGALLVAVENSTHDTFSDLPLLFATRFSWALSRVRLLGAQGAALRVPGRGRRPLAGAVADNNAIMWMARAASRHPKEGAVAAIMG